MGELDITISHPDTGLSGYVYAFRTVFFLWAPLAVAGIALHRLRVAHATMRGAGALRVLARLAIAIELAALTFSLLFVGIFLGAFWDDVVSMTEFFAGAVLGVTLLAGGAALSAAGITAWHHVLNDLSHRGESRVLM